MGVKVFSERLAGLGRIDCLQFCDVFDEVSVICNGVKIGIAFVMLGIFTLALLL